MEEKIKLIMKEEKKKEFKTKADEGVGLINSVIVLIALIGAIVTVVVLPALDQIIDNILLYTVAPIVLTVIYTFLIYLLWGIITILIGPITCLFTKNKIEADVVFNNIILDIALIGAILTLIFGYPNLQFPDDWILYILIPVIFTIIYFIGFYLFCGIIFLLISFIIDTFIKNK